MSAMNIYTDDTDTLTTNAFTKDYYHFLGWSLTADGTVAYEDNADYTMGTESAYTLYAVWEADVYTITYELAGGVNNAGNTTTKYTVESNTIPLLTPTRAYYDFVEWQIDSVAVTEITAGSHGDVTVTAVWDPTEYLITYNLNGGTNGANPETYNVEDEFTFAEPTRTAYTFGGWYTDEECTQAKTGIALGEHGEIAIYAKNIYFRTKKPNNNSIIILSHLGKVKSESDKEKNTLYPVYLKLKEYINTNIYFSKQTRGEELEKLVNNLKLH